MVTGQLFLDDYDVLGAGIREAGYESVCDEVVGREELSVFAGRSE